MADNTVTASGPTRGASYVLPWDTMAQYDQMVTATRDKFETQNQQRLATIADMEKQDLTGMPSYDKALENHYEQLHGQVGKIITKYRDPFQSLEGMRALKDVQAKYIANPIVNNAKTTEDSFKRLQSDYATNLITPEDYNIKKGEYDKHITEGDVSNPFEYGRPDYLQSSKIFDDVFKDMDKSVLSQSPNGSTVGYSDPQFDQAVNLAMIGQHGAALEREIDQNLTQQGITINEQSRQAEGVRLAKLYKPLDKNKIYHSQSEGGSSINYIPSEDIYKNGIPKEHVSEVIERDANSKYISNIDVLGSNIKGRSFPTNGAAIIFQSADAIRPGDNFANATVLMPRQKVAEGFMQNINKIIREGKIPGLTPTGLFIQAVDQTSSKGDAIPGVNALGNLTEPQFRALAKSIDLTPKDGFTSDQPGAFDFIRDNFNSGEYQLGTGFVSDGQGKLGEKGSLVNPNVYTANAILFHQLGLGISKQIDPASVNSDIRDLMNKIQYGDKATTDWVSVSGTQLPYRVDNTKLRQFNEKMGMKPADADKVQMAYNQTGSNSRVLTKYGSEFQYTGTDDWAGMGVRDNNNRLHGNIGQNNLGEVLNNPITRISFVDQYEQIKKQPTTLSDKGKSPFERIVRGTPSLINDVVTADGAKDSFDNQTNLILVKAGYDFKNNKYKLSGLNNLNSTEKTLFEAKLDFLHNQGIKTEIIPEEEVKK